MSRAASISDFRDLARRRLPRFLYEYVDGGAYEERTLHRNCEDLANVALRQRVLRDVSCISLETSLFGTAASMPVILGPVGLAGMLARRGEVQAAARPRWAYDVGLKGRPHGLGNVAPILQGRTGLEDYFGWMRDSFDASATWTDLSWVREQWPGPLMVKGILEADDARRALDKGADGLIVSNHGGRQLDGVPS